MKCIGMGMFGEIGESTHVVEMEMRNDDAVNHFIVRLSGWIVICQLLEIREFAMIGISHMNTAIKHYCFIIETTYDAASSYILPRAKNNHLDVVAGEKRHDAMQGKNQRVKVRSSWK